MRRSAIIATAASFAGATPALVSTRGVLFGSNYNFPDGLAGFDLQATNAQNTDLATDGILNP